MDRSRWEPMYRHRLKRRRIGADCYKYRIARYRDKNTILYTNTETGTVLLRQNSHVPLYRNSLI